MRFELIGNSNIQSNNDGVIYFVQRIEEMLMPFTSHLYKVPVLNTYLLAYEFLDIYIDVDKELIDKAHLNIILEEFISSFEADIVVKEHFSEEQIKYFINRLNESSIPDKHRTMSYLINIMSNYSDWCIDLLKNTLYDSKEKKKIEKILRSYIPMLIGEGYNPYFIKLKCKDIFGESNIDDGAFVDKFISVFNGVKNKYEVYFTVSKLVEKFKYILEERLRISFEKNEYSAKLKIDENKQMCIHIETKALDPNETARNAYNIFNLFMRYYRFLGNREDEWLGKKCLVIDKNGDYVFPHIGKDKYFYSRNFDDKTLGINSERIITSLLENAKRDDFYKIDKVIQTHNTALNSYDINNSFLNLWSVIEIIGVDGFGGDKSKINQILTNIVPILKRNYVNRIFEELHDYLKANLDIESYNELISGINEEGTDEYKIACMVALDEYEDIRQKAYEYLSCYPLIRSRIYQLHEDVFKKKKLFLSEIKRYDRRISWHLQRLYRVRNSIIHSGKECDNIVSLVEHLHSYVDEIVLDIIDRMTRNQNLNTIANVLIDAQVYIEKINKEFSKSDEFTPAEIKMILD